MNKTLHKISNAAARTAAIALAIACAGAVTLFWVAALVFAITGYSVHG